MTVEIKNATVTWSSLLRKKDKDLKSRSFSIELPSDSPEIEKLRKDFEDLNQKAMAGFTKDKKVKPVDKYGNKLGKSLFTDNEYNPGFTRLEFSIFGTKEVEKELEDGTKKTVQEEELKRMYKNLDFMYRVNNDGKKEYYIDGTDKHWLVGGGDTVDIKCSLVASYLKAKNRVHIALKADDVKIVKTSYTGGGGNGGFITLSDENEEIETKVEKAKPAKDDSVTFTADELQELDI